MHEAMGRGTARALGEGWSDFTWRRVCADEEYGVTLFTAWNEHVRRSVPAEKLLEFETGKHGYAELIEFLDLGEGVLPPDAAYPWTNSKQEFEVASTIMRVTAVLTSVVPVAVAWCACGRRRAIKVKGGV